MQTQSLSPDLHFLSLFNFFFLWFICRMTWKKWRTATKWGGMKWKDLFWHHAPQKTKAKMLRSNEYFSGLKLVQNKWSWGKCPCCEMHLSFDDDRNVYLVICNLPLHKYKHTRKMSLRSFRHILRATILNFTLSGNVNLQWRANTWCTLAQFLQHDLQRNCTSLK